MTTATTAGDTVREDWFVSLAEATDARRVGGKARPLALAMAAGHRVPGGFVVAADAMSDAARVRSTLVDALERLGGGPFAVRSSAVGEDGRERSFAGQLETKLSVPAGGVLAAVEACWASANALRAVRYGGDLGAVAVVVQRMVAADAAGVAFSADPHSGERGVVVIEAVPSLGHRLVSGEVDPESWRREGSRCERTRRGDAQALTEEQARRVAALAREMEKLFGAPQDVEWALADGELFLLQSRPITALPAAPVPIAIDPPEGGWDRDDHHGVLSPLGWSWLLPYPKALAEAFKSSGAPVERMEPTRIGGHLYMKMVMGGGESSKLPPRWVLWAASRLVPSLRRANQTAARFIDEEQFMDVADAWLERDRDALREEIDRTMVDDPRALDDDALLASIDAAMDISARGLEKHAWLHGPGFFGIGKLALFAEDELGWTFDTVLGVVAGSSSATTALHDQLEAIVRRHVDELDAADAPFRTWASLLVQCPNLGRELAAWLDDNRLRMTHYDPKHPTLGERPQHVMSIVEGIAHHLAAGEDAERVVHSGDELVDQAAATLSPAKAEELRRLVALARKGYGLREGNAVESVSRPAGLLRHFVLELGRRIEPAIGAAEHAVYLYPEEHGPALRGEIDDVGDRIERRRGEESWALLNRGPRRYGPPKPPMPPADVFPDGMSRMMRIINWIEESQATPEPAEGDVLPGIGIGTRVVTGRARVIHRPEHIGRLRHGEIAVCRITSPEWSVALGRVEALVTNEGGSLSHPAIIARELGVPAVVGAADATHRIATGDRIRVDPVEGTVSLLRSSQEPTKDQRSP